MAFSQAVFENIDGKGAKLQQIGDPGNTLRVVETRKVRIVSLRLKNTQATLNFVKLWQNPALVVSGTTFPRICLPVAASTGEYTAVPDDEDSQPVMNGIGIMSVTTGGKDNTTGGATAQTIWLLTKIFA